MFGENLGSENRDMQVFERRLFEAEDLVGEEINIHRPQCVVS